MLKRGDYKLCHYVGSEPQLFNVDADPLENDDLASKPEYAVRRSEMEIALHAILDPERENARAKENHGCVEHRLGYLTVKLRRPNNSGLGSLR